MCAAPHQDFYEQDSSFAATEMFLGSDVDACHVRLAGMVNTAGLQHLLQQPGPLDSERANSLLARGADPTYFSPQEKEKLGPELYAAFSRARMSCGGNNTPYQHRQW